MADKIGSLAATLTLNDAQYAQALATNARRTQAFSGDISKAFEGFPKTVARSAAGIVAGFLSLDAVMRSTRGAIELGDRFATLSEETDLSFRSLQVLDFGLRKHQTSIDGLVPAYNKLRDQIGIALQDSSSSAAKAFSTLGISVAQFAKLTPEAQLEAIGRASLQAADPTRAFSAIVDLLGKDSAPRLISSLRDLATNGFGAMADAAERAGQVLDTKLVEALANAKQATDDFARRWSVKWGEIVFTVLNSYDQMFGESDEARLRARIARFEKNIADLTPKAKAGDVVAGIQLETDTASLSEARKQLAKLTGKRDDIIASLDTSTASGARREFDFEQGDAQKKQIENAAKAAKIAQDEQRRVDDRVKGILDASADKIFVTSLKRADRLVELAQRAARELETSGTKTIPEEARVAAAKRYAELSAEISKLERENGDESKARIKEIAGDAIRAAQALAAEADAITAPLRTPLDEYNDTIAKATELERKHALKTGEFARVSEDALKKLNEANLDALNRKLDAAADRIGELASRVDFISANAGAGSNRTNARRAADERRKFLEAASRPTGGNEAMFHFNEWERLAGNIRFAPLSPEAMELLPGGRAGARMRQDAAAESDVPDEHKLRLIDNSFDWTRPGAVLMASPEQRAAHARITGIGDPAWPAGGDRFDDMRTRIDDRFASMRGNLPTGIAEMSVPRFDVGLAGRSPPGSGEAGSSRQSGLSKDAKAIVDKIKDFIDAFNNKIGVARK